MIKFLLGLVIGFVIAIGYYDGVVAKEYKDKIAKAAEALVRADQELLEKEQQIELLLQHIEKLKKHYNSLSKFVNFDQTDSRKTALPESLKDCSTHKHLQNNPAGLVSN